MDKLTELQKPFLEKPVVVKQETDIAGKIRVLLEVKEDVILNLKFDGKMTKKQIDDEINKIVNRHKEQETKEIKLIELEDQVKQLKMELYGITD